MHTVKRPTVGETEEDILNEEKDFLEQLKSGKVVPSVKIVKADKYKQIKTFSTSGPSSSELSFPTETERGCDGGSGSNDFKAKTHEEDEDQIENPNEAVVFQIKEREFDPLKLKDFVKTDASTKILRVRVTETNDNVVQGTAVKRKKSLFAKSFDARKEVQKKERHSGKPDGQSENCKKLKTVDPLPDLGPSSSLEGPVPEAIGEKIHPLLAGMTEEDILQEQKKLLERLDPNLVNFIRNRSLKKESNQMPGSGEPMEIQEVGKTDKSKSTWDIEESDLPIDPKTVESYPGMQKVELTKLAWAGVVRDVKKDDTLLSQTCGKNARFDFSGELLSEDKQNDPSTYERALHNHGEEMERPGYTIEELLTLARSVNSQQRTIALETLGNIYLQAHTGIYDEVLEKSIFHLMDFMEFIHAIRKGLDNTDSGSINSALFCLSSLLYPEHEEACLDATYLWPNPRPFPLLTTKPDEVKIGEAEKEMKDFEFLQLDLLDFLLSRTEILTRIEYLLTLKFELFNEKGVISVLKILIRLARHSPYLVLRHEKLIKYIVENHISANWIILQNRDRSLKGTPLVHALKLMRVLVESSATNAMKVYEGYRVFPPVMAYLAYDQWREQTHVQEVENLVLESFKIWLSFLDLGIGIEEYIALFPILMQLLRFYGLSTELNSFDLHHSAHLFSLFKQIISFRSSSVRDPGKVHSHWELVKDAVSLVDEHCRKIMKILCSPHLHDRYNNDLALLSLGKGIEFLAQVKKHTNLDNLRQLLIEFSKCSAYLKLTGNLISHSVILQEAPEKTRYPSNFVSIGAVKWEGELNPVMRSNSPFYFFSYLFTFMKHVFPADAASIIMNKAIEEYLWQLESYKKSLDVCDYFVRFELQFISNLLSLLPRDYATKFSVSYKALAIVPTSCTDLFKSLLKESLATCCNPKDVEVVYQFYVAYFLPNDELPEEAYTTSSKVRFEDGGHPGDGKGTESNILFQHWSKKLVEPHWIFHPLENLYRRAVSTPGYATENALILEQEARGCLSFIQHCLRDYSESIIQTSQDLVTLYCRICRVFMLGNPNVYFDEITVTALKEILQILMTGKILVSSKKCIFSKRKPSVSAAVSFYDFYSELVTEYFDNSYFNEVFAAYLLLPLRSSEDVNVKRCFWSHEHLHCVRLTQEKVPIPVGYLTQDQEKDPQMLLLYTGLIRRKFLVKDINPFLYEIVSTHLKNSLEFMTDELKKDFNKLAI